MSKKVKIEWISDKIIEGCFGSPFSHVLSFHNSFLYISNFTDIFIAVQKIISWKAGKTELICLHGGLRFPYIGYVTSCVLNIDGACSAAHND